MRSFKTNRIVALAALTAVTAQLFTTTAVSAAGYKLADKTGKSIAELRDEVLTIKKEVDATLVALDKVITTAASDPRKAYQEFDKAVPRIDDAAKKARKRSEDMKAQGQTYFKQWEKELAEVSNPDIRKLAEDRKAELSATFNNIKTTMEPAKQQFNTWLADLKDLQAFLSNDLTVGGIDAAKDLIAKTKTEGQGVQQTLDKVIAELNTVVAKLTPAQTKK